MWSSTLQCWEPCSTVLGAALPSSTTLMPPAKEQWISGARSAVQETGLWGSAPGGGREGDILDPRSSKHVLWRDT